MIIAVLSTALAGLPSRAGAGEARPAPLSCRYGPLARSYAATDWLVFACEGDDQLVLATPRGNPAYFSYILVRWRSGALQTYAEGGGDQKARDAAKEEISHLSRSEFLALREAVVRRGEAKSSQPPQAPKTGLSETPGALPYPSVAAALQSVKTNPDIEISTKDGWTIGYDKKAGIVWSFVPIGHPAYPAVVRRETVPSGQMASIAMQIRCEASKEACDKLVLDFEAMNKRIAEDLKRRLAPH